MPEYVQLRRARVAVAENVPRLFGTSACAPFPGMDCKSDDDKSYKRGNVMSLEYYMATLLAMFRHVRIWPVTSFTLCKTFLVTTGTNISLMAIFLVLLSEIVALMMITSLKLFANIIGVICMHVTGLIKWCYCIRYNEEIVHIVTKLEKCHVLCQQFDNCEKVSQIYKDEMEYARRWSNWYLWWSLCIYIYGVIHWCSNPFLAHLLADHTNSINQTFRKINLPYIGWYPIDIDDMENFICVYLLQFSGSISSVLGIAWFDAFYICMVLIICAQFQYINTILENTDFHNATFALERKLKNCLDCHVQIIKFLEMLQTFASPAMFVQCIETLVLICLVSFDVATVEIAFHPEHIFKLWSLFEYLILSCIQLYVFCFVATRLEQLGTQIACSVYFCGWERWVFKECQSNFSGQKDGLKYYNIKRLRLVQMIMLRAQKPIILTGGPFYKLSLETFKVIISMAISNCIVLRTMSETDN
ncbi:odorant receptor 13a isoform X2 [Ooceraea biroi]|uniref:odorant receptor 13a isoform X2 n=1 Tax=Ooceraea biroi TaxID=2015173 RepID=UPI000F07E5AA|nr:odorant receptor 13a isoform X2 [Ooceraea biroi]